MVIERFDKCSDLDEYYKNNYTYRNMSASEDTLSSCDKLQELSNEHDNNLKTMTLANETSNVSTGTNFFDINIDNDLNAEGVKLIFNKVPGLPIYLAIILTIITTIFIAIPLVPVILTSSLTFLIFFVMFMIILIILIITTIYSTFN